MSTIHVRNLVGIGPFATPTTGAMLDAASAEWRAILGGVANLSYEGAYSMVFNQPAAVGQEQVLSVETWVYDHDIAKPETVVAQLRAAIASALSANSNVTSHGDIDIQMWRQGAFYEQAPRVTKVNRQTGTVYFADSIPPGAQIEIYKFNKHKQHPDHSRGGIYPARLGPRYRPDRMLAVGATEWTLPATIVNVWTRQHFRFAYRWPEPPNTDAPAPGIRGPLSPTGLSTGSRGERNYGVRILLVPSPRRPLGTD